MKVYSYYTLPALLLVSLSAQADVIDWTGGYAGVSLGAARQPEQYRDMLPDGSNVTIANETARGSTAGIHAGYNHQINQLVFGIEADLEQPNLKNKITPYGRDSWGAKTETLVQGSIRPRIGYTFQRALIYGTTGLKKVVLIANTPSNKEIKGLITFDIDKLKEKAIALSVKEEDYNATIKASLREAIRNHIGSKIKLELQEIEIFSQGRT